MNNDELIFDSNRIFSPQQMMGIIALFADERKRASVIRWLYENYRIQISNLVHDSYELLVPDSYTKEDGDVIYGALTLYFS